MKTKMIAKKLSLNKETIATLQVKEIGEVKGGSLHFFSLGSPFGIFEICGIINTDTTRP